MGGRDRGGRMSDMGPDKTDTDWRARPSADADDGPPKRDDAFGESESELALFCAATSIFIDPKIVLLAVFDKWNLFLGITGVNPHLIRIR